MKAVLPVLLGLVVATAVPLHAQQRIPRSQRGSVMQMIGQTEVTVALIVVDS